MLTNGRKAVVDTSYSHVIISYENAHVFVRNDQLVSDTEVSSGYRVSNRNASGYGIGLTNSSDYIVIYKD